MSPAPGHGDHPGRGDLVEQRTCAVDGCERRYSARGFCHQHYVRWRNTGDCGPAEFRVVTDSRIRDEDGRKRCTRCGRWREVGRFYRAATAADGLHSHCDTCYQSRMLREVYGVTLDWYEATLAAQGNGCAICGGLNGNGRMLCVDHDHGCCPGKKACGRCARSLLCTKCNTGIGMFGDDIALLQAAIDYLKRGARGAETATS